eukprot:9246163-Lingulodinium_polyedra.AAC.1
MRAAVLEQGGFRLMQGQDARRRAPPGERRQINQICDPTNLRIWAVAGAERDGLIAEGTVLAEMADASERAGRA